MGIVGQARDSPNSRLRVAAPSILGRKVHSLKHRFIARVGAYAIELRHDPDFPKKGNELVTCLIEPHKRLIFVTQPGVNFCNQQGRQPDGLFLQPANGFCRLTFISGQGGDVAALG